MWIPECAAFIETQRLLEEIRHLENFINRRKNNKEICTIGDTNLDLIDLETNIKVKNYLNLLFQKTSYSHHI